MLKRSRADTRKIVDETENGYRRLIRHHFYGSQTLPTRSPDSVVTDYTPAYPYNQYSVSSNKLARIDQIVNTVGGDVTIYSYHYVNSDGGTKLAITHEGHSYFNLPNHAYHIGKLLDAGWNVVAVQMPMVFIGPNPPYPDALSDTEKAVNHPDWMQAREDLNANAVKIFLEPTLFTKAHLVSTYGYSTIIMVGISGGGWTVNMVAALDTDIAASWCVAGSMPFDMRNHVSRGDFEQLARSGVSSTFQTPTVARPFYAYLPLEYHDLYAMSATHGRFARLVYIESDGSGSFQPDGRHGQIDQYVRLADQRVSGTVTVAYDTSQAVHCISNWTGNLIISDLQELGL